jgi:hypothetical protein
VSQTPTASEGLEVKPLKKIYVDTRDYNIIRSVVESSTKPMYHWNEPVEALVPGDGIKFVKYKFRTKMWEVVIQQTTLERENQELFIDYIVVFDGERNEVVTCAIRHQFAPDEEEKKNYIIRICGSCDDIVITANSLHELEYYVIEPSCCVPYAEPISLADLVNKLIYFYKKAILSRFSY